MKYINVAQGSGRRRMQSPRRPWWSRCRAFRAGFLGVLGSTACSVVSGAAKPGFALPARLPLRRVRTNAVRRATGCLFGGCGDFRGDCYGDRCREGEGWGWGWGLAERASASMTRHSGRDSGRPSRRECAGPAGGAAPGIEPVTPAAADAAELAQARQRSLSQGSTSGSFPLSSAELPGHRDKNSPLQQNLQQERQSPKRSGRVAVAGMAAAAIVSPPKTVPCGTTAHPTGPGRFELAPAIALCATGTRPQASGKTAPADGVSRRATARIDGGESVEHSAHRDARFQCGRGFTGGRHDRHAQHAVTLEKVTREGPRSSENGRRSATSLASGLTRVKQDRGGKGRRARVEGNGATRQRNIPSPNKRPPGKPFGASKARAWHVQQSVQSAVTPTQAMRAVLDFPLRANYITVSTALNRVAKLAPEKWTRGLATDEEHRCLEVLLKVTEELVASGVVNARNLAQLLWSLAKIGNPEACSGNIWKHPEKGLKENDPLKLREGREDEGKGSLATLIAGNLSKKTRECKPVELAMAAWGLATLRERDEACLSAIAKEVSLRAHEFRGQELGNVVWAFAVLDYRKKEMLEAVAEVLSPEPLEWSGRVTWEWKESRVGRNGESGTWKASIDQSWSSGNENVADRPAAELAGVAAAAAAAAAAVTDNNRNHDEDALAFPDEERNIRIKVLSSNSEDGEVKGAPEVEAREIMEEGAAPLPGSSPSAGLASLLIARDSPSAVTAATQATRPTGGGWQPPLFAFHATDVREKKQRVAGQERLGEAGPTAVRGAISGNAADGAAEEDREHWKCASEVEVASVVLTPQDLALLSWGFSSLSQEWLPGQPAAYRAIAALADAAKNCTGNLRPQDISMVSVALARLSWDDPELMRAMMARTVDTLGAFKPQELSNMAWACARLHALDPRFWSSVQTQTKRILTGQGMKAQETTNLAWSLAVMGEADSVLLADLFRSAQAQRGDLTAIESHQLYQVYLLWQDDIPDLWRELDKEFMQELRRRWTDNQERMKRSSHNHLEVSEILELMQISHENESEHDIDIEIVGVGLASEDWDFRSFATGAGPNPADPAEVRLKLALEVDGPAHFTKNTARPLGHMVLKHRTLAKMGWTVVSIPFFEWDPIPFWSSMEKKRYLQRKLGITRTIFFGGIDCSNFKGWSTRLGKTSRYH